MSKLTIIRGLQASGKSTLAKKMLQDSLTDPKPAMIVERDALRSMAGLDLGAQPGPYESTITLQQHTLIRAGLKANRHVISSDTNLNSRTVKELAKIAAKFGAEVVIRDIDTPLEECILRDQTRGGTGGHEVGAEVIRRTHKRYFIGGEFPANPLQGDLSGVKLEPYRPNLAMRKAKIYDVDGTLADHRGVRSPYDYTMVHLDKPHADVVQQMRDDYALGYALIVLSGREDSCREATEQWLRVETQLPIGYEIPVYMRTTGDDRADFIVKYELFRDNIADHYNVVGVYDDRDQVVQLWRDIGVRCYQVNYGDF